MLLPTWCSAASADVGGGNGRRTAWLPDHTEQDGLLMPCLGAVVRGIVRPSRQQIQDAGPTHPVIADPGEEIQARLQWADAGRTGDSPAGFFVYGTLCRGQSNAHVLESHGVRSRTSAAVQGELWDFGPWPGARFSRSAVGSVTGELVEVERMSAAILALDALEEFPGWFTPGGMYRRTIVWANGVPWWSYQVQDVGKGRRLLTGDWCRR